LQHEGKAELLAHAGEIELGHDRVAHAVVETIGRRYVPARDDLLGHAEVVEQLERGRVDRSGALIAHGRRLLLAYRDRDAAPMQRERAHHADRAGPDHEHARGAGHRGYCTWSPRSRTTSRQRAVSAAMMAANSSGVLIAGSTPIFCSRSRNSGVFSAAATSRPIASTISRGVFAGARSPWIVITGGLLSVSRMVGRSGNCGERSALLIPRNFTLPEAK